jgi:hypothetical protein
MDVVGEKTEFIIGEMEGDYRCGLCQVEWRHLMQGKEKGRLILGHFYTIVNLEVGRRPVSLPIYNGLLAKRRIWAD